MIPASASFLLLSVSLSSALVTSDSDSPPNSEPFLGSYDIEDSCQYRLCGKDFVEEFGGGDRPRAGSCSGDCNNLAHKLVNSRFKKEFMWGKCSDMCVEKYPLDEYRTYTERLSCMTECFDSFEYVKPHHKIARACVHAACPDHVRAETGQTSLECFDRCTHHVATRVPEEDWPTWANLLATASCPKSTLPGAALDRLGCTDKALWEGLTRQTSISPDVHLLCLNAMCDNNVRCAKECLSHVTSDIDPTDLPRWQQCTYSSTCAEINTYAARATCADGCLDNHKAAVAKAAEERRRQEERRRAAEKEARALAASGATEVVGVAKGLLSMALVISMWL